MDNSEIEGIVRKVLEEKTAGVKAPSPSRGITTGTAGKEGPDPSLVTTGTSGKPTSYTSRVTIGTAGKVFSADNAASAVKSSCSLKNGSSEECLECDQCVVKRPEDVKKIIGAGASSISALHPGDLKNSGYDADVAAMIDHTLLKANVTQEQIGKLCEEAKKYNFASVCVNPAYVSLAAQLLKGYPSRVTTVIGFPLGATTPTTKAIEARDAIAAGADEIDMVINIGALKSGNYGLVLDDIKAVREATRGHILKVIIETALLTKEEKIKASELTKEAGADYVKTSTGFSTGGATVDDVKLMRSVVGPSMGIKAAGGVHNLDEAKAMAKAGATRIGASASIAIVTGGESKSNY